MILPALYDLAGKADITFVGRQPGLDYIRSFINRGLDLEAAGWHRLFLESPDDHTLPVSRADMVVAFFSGETRTIRQNLNACFPYLSVHVFPSFPSEKKDIHAARYLAECLKEAGLPVDPSQSMEKAVRKPLLGDMALPAVRSTIVLHPGSGDKKKNHAPGFWLKLLEGLGQRACFQGLTCLVLLGPAEEDVHPFFKKNLKSLDAKICFCPEKSILTRIITEAGLYIGHDSGITHLAAMLGTPTVALFKRSNAIQWGPLGPRVRVIKECDTGVSFLMEKVFEAATDVFKSS